MSIHCLSWNKWNILVAKLVGFVEICIFRHFVPAFPCEQQEKRALFSWWHVRQRIDHWFSVTTGNCQPSGPPLHWLKFNRECIFRTYYECLGIYNIKIRMAKFLSMLMFICVGSFSWIYAQNFQITHKYDSYFQISGVHNLGVYGSADRSTCQK